MEKDRGYRVIAIIALCVAIVGLSIGFAAFTKDLNVTFSESNVKVSGDLDVKILASDDVNDTSTTVVGSIDDSADPADPPSNIGTATISTDGTTISGMGATFSNKDQLVSYTFYIYNNSEYDAYFDEIEFLPYAAGENSNYTEEELDSVYESSHHDCVALEGTDYDLMSNACEDIHRMVLVDDSYEFTENTSLEAVQIPKGEMIPVTIYIGYVGGGLHYIFGIEGEALVPNGPFKVNFGSISFRFSSLER